MTKIFCYIKRDQLMADGETMMRLLTAPLPKGRGFLFQGVMPEVH
jgi:hypothetical protein